MNPNIEVVQAIWSRGAGSYVSLPVKRGDLWINRGMVPVNEVDNTAFFSRSETDYYFSPLTYLKASKGRTRDNVERAGVLYADMDGGASPKALRVLHSIPPTLYINSGTPHHSHLYWFLDGTIPLDAWEIINRDLTYTIGADTGGWDATQVLRVPGTYNNKPDNMRSPVEVEVEYFYPERVYTPAIILGAISSETHGPLIRPNSMVPDGGPPVVSRDDYYAALRIVWGDLTPPQQMVFTGAEAAAHRYKVIWGIINRLIERGYTDEQIYRSMAFAPFNKFVEEGRPGDMWKQIKKARRES